MINKGVILPVLTLSLLTNCASLKQDATKEIAKKKAKEMVAKLGINQSYIKEGESCKYLGFIGSTDTNKAMQDGGIKYKLFSATDKGTIKQCTYAFGLEKTPQEMLAGKVKNIFKR